MDDETAKSAEARVGPREIESQPVPLRVLLGGRTELLIELNGEIYSLRLTRRGRLVLTKSL